MLRPHVPALALAPMDGITDAPMRALQGTVGAFTYAVSEFIRVAGEPMPSRVFLRDVPEIANGARTQTGLPVQVQILGGHPERMALSALAACSAGATAIDINFGCPAPTVNRHDGGASLLIHPDRIRDIVSAVRTSVPSEIPVSAKLRLGWDSVESIFQNAAMAAEGGADWITIHARTRVQNYAPPVNWKLVGDVRKTVAIPVVANGDIWTIDDFRRCREETGCIHFMIGRGALANPALPHQIAKALGIDRGKPGIEPDWMPMLRALVSYTDGYPSGTPRGLLMRLKQWLRIATRFGDFRHFDAVKCAASTGEFFAELENALSQDQRLARAV